MFEHKFNFGSMCVCPAPTFSLHLQKVTRILLDVIMNFVYSF